MKRIVYLIGDTQDREIINQVYESLKNEELNLIICTTDLLFNRWSIATNADLAILFISPALKNEGYRISKERYAASKPTFNFFLSPIVLNDYQKDCIGKNRSVFWEIDKNKSIEDLSSLLTEAQSYPLPEQNQGNGFNEEYATNYKSGNGKKWFGLIATACIIGAGIWGYSAYVESAKKEAELALWEAWEKYATDTQAGQIIATLAENLENIDENTFLETGFHNYIEGRLEPSSEVSLSKISHLIKDLNINVSKSANISAIMSDNFRSLYREAIEANYEETGEWNPVKDLLNISNIKIMNVTLGNPINTITYTIGIDYQNPINILFIKNKNGSWEIYDFERNDGYTFSSLLEDFIEQKNVIDMAFFGEMSNESNNFQIYLNLLLKSKGVLTGTFEIISQNVSVAISGHAEDGFISLSGDNNGENLQFELVMKADHSLTGTLMVSSDKENSMIFNVVLKEYVP